MITVTRRRSLTPTLALLLAALALAGCTTSAAPQGRPDTTDSTSSWPRTIPTQKGEVELTAAPKRIVSTSVTITGTLLAINAPVVASGATNANTEVADENGFFTQWGDIAVERGVEPLYNGDANVETVIPADPDLIVVAATGGDSTLPLYDQLSTVAPTIVIDYGDKSWQQLATVLGTATGHEKDAEKAIADFDARVSAAKTAITLPPQPTSAMVYFADGSGANVWTAESAQGKLLDQLGFDVAAVPDADRDAATMGIRNDIVQVSAENLTEGLTGKTLILISADETLVPTVEANPLLSAHAAVNAHHVYAMGLDTFRLDYYSSTNFVDRMVKLFG